MTTSFRDWQPGHFHLSAPALQVLRYGPDRDPTDIFNLALRELIGNGLLIPTTLQAGTGMDTVRTIAFATGRTAPDDLERSLHSVLDAHATATAHAGQVTLQEVARSLREKHDGTLAKWVEDEVLAVLIEHKLYEKEEGKRLGIIPTTSLELTGEGRAAKAQLEVALKRVEDQWSDWASDDAQRAQTFLKLAGSAVLLISDIHESIAKFRAAQTGGAPADSIGNASGFDMDRIALYAHELTVLDDVIAYTHLDEDRDNDPSTPA